MEGCIPQTDTQGSNSILRLITGSLDSDKAEDIVTIELSGKCSFADHMVVATGRSSRHLASLSDKLIEQLKDAGEPPLSVEGKDSGDWVLIDAGDTIVHLFREEVREMYNLEKMWSLPVPQMEVAL